MEPLHLDTLRTQPTTQDIATLLAASAIISLITVATLNWAANRAWRELNQLPKRKQN